MIKLKPKVLRRIRVTLTDGDEELVKTLMADLVEAKNEVFELNISKD